MCGSDIFLGLLAILFPPIAVWVKRGICSADSLINIALCCLGFLPGLLHAWYIISVTPDPTYMEIPDSERGGGGHVTYYYVQSQPNYKPQGGHQSRYGTVDSTPNSQFPARQEGFVQPQGAPAGAPPPPQAGPSDEVPPSYQQAVGDNKVQHP